MQKLKYMLLFLSLLIFACVKDNSSTTGIELNDVNIKGIEKVYNLQLGGTLTIHPIIETKHNDDSQLKYVWYKYDLGMTSRDTLSFEKNLSTVISDVAPGVECFVVLKVIDQSTGVYYMNRTSLFTSAKYSGGIVALTRDGANVDMAFLKTENGELTNNMFSTLNPGITLNPKSNRIFYVDPVDTNPTEFRRVVIATNDENIGIVLNSDLLTKEKYLSETFVLPLDKGKNHELTCYSNNNSKELIVVDGQLYDRNADAWTTGSLFNPAIISTVSPNYKISPLPMHAHGDYGNPLFFDNVTGCFMCYSNSSSSFTSLTEGPKVTFTHFNPNNLSGYELIAAGTTAEVTEDLIGDWYTLLKEKSTGNYRMLSFFDRNVDWYLTYKTLWSREISKTECPMLYQATQIIGGDRINPRTSNPWLYYNTGFPGMMFYLVNNNVYVYNVATGSELKLIDGTASGFTINKIVICKTAYINSESKVSYLPRLGLCIQDNASATKKGGVAYYRISTLGGISANQYFKKTGFCDEVIDFTEKLN